jgi:dTDP-4-amino-4,6-dideoxygalactose transaminase
MSPTLSPSVPADRYAAHKTALDGAVAEVLSSGWFILGRQTAAFEQEFAAFLGAAHGVGVGSGTDALEIALRACGIGPGDAVLTVSHTAVATVAAIERAGATPVLVDIDPVTFTLDPERLHDAIAAYQSGPAASGRPRLKAVIPVHLYGQPADLPAILEVARRHELRVIEDCAQSHGASLRERMTGTWGDLAAFSFYPTKNLGAFGDGGAVVTNDPTLAQRVKLLREYGWQPRPISALPGLNSRLDELQAGFLRVLLKALPEENARRRRLAEQYDEVLASTALLPPRPRAGAVHVFHQYVIRTPLRDDLKAFLETQGIGTQIHYPVPVHLQPAYRGRLFCSPGGLPHTEAAAREILSLPMSPYLKPPQVEATLASLNRWVACPRALGP